MALSVGVEWRQFCDVGQYVTDTEEEEEESDEEGFGSSFASVGVVGSKRTYGVFQEARFSSSSSRKRSRVDEQLELLRAAIPNLCTTEQSSILVAAYEYIEKLQRQVQELQSELDEEEEEMSCCCCCTTADECCREGATVVVEVVRTAEGLKIHIQCAKRPRVLVDIMELLESSGMSVEQVSIAYQEDSQIVFDCLGSQVDGSDGIAADSRHVEACLRSLIRDDVA